MRRSVEAVFEQSVVLREMIEGGHIALVGAMYSVETGGMDPFDQSARA